MATRPAPRYAKDPVALAKLRRERAFSSPAPKVEVKAKPASYNRFGIGVKPGDSVGQDVIGGTSGPISEATGLGDFINRLGRNYTVDVGDATSRVIQDTFLGGKGKSSLIDNGAVSLAEFARNPSAGVAKFITNNALNNPDAMQVAAPGDFIGAGSLAKGAATVAGKVAKPLIPVATSKVGKAAAATTAALGGFGAIDTDNAMAMNVNPSVLKTVLNKGGVQGLSNLLNDAVNDVPAAAKEASKLIGRQDKTGRVRSIFSDINRNYDKRVLAAQTGVANTGSAIQDLWSTTPKIFRDAVLKTHYATTGSVPLNQKDMYKATSKLLSDLQAKYGDDVVSIENALLNPEGGKWTWGHFGDVAKGAPHGVDFGGWQEATANFARRTFN